jgi:hypothetical protein
MELWVNVVKLKPAKKHICLSNKLVIKGATFPQQIIQDIIKENFRIKYNRSLHQWLKNPELVMHTYFPRPRGVQRI